MKKVYTVDMGALDSLDWLLIMMGAAGTIMSTAALIIWIYKIVIFLIQVGSGKKSIRSKKFWINMGVSLLLIFTFMSGAILLFLGKLFDFF
jgi:hypothetical protein